MPFFYKLTVAYDGTEFHGSQRQISNAAMDQSRRDKKMAFANKKRRRAENNTSVQEEIEDAFLHLLPEIQSVADLQLRFAGRTDKGVHATGQVVVVCLPQQQPGACWELRRSLNSRLPATVSIECVEPCSDVALNPRRDCVRKVYEYSIRFRCHDDRLPDTFLHGPHLIRSALDNETRLWICPWALEYEKIDQICTELQGTHDYSNFIHREERSSGRDHIMTIDEIIFIVDHEKTDQVRAGEDSEMISSKVITGRFRLTAASFRRSMVRLIVGYYVDCCRVPAKRNAAAFAPNEFCDHTAPACGLCLKSVTY